MNNQSLTRLAKLSLAVTLGLLLIGCGSPKKYAYLQDVELAKHYSVEHDTYVRIMPGDKLNFYVISAYPELVRPFNGDGFDMSMPTGVGSVQSLTNRQDYEAQSIRARGYSVDTEGYITLPVLGKVKAEGMTLRELKKDLEARIVANKYVSDPIVTLQFANFHIYLMGAAPRTGGGGSAGGSGVGYSSHGASFARFAGIDGGVLRIYDQERVSILDALALAGELPINANLAKVNVIRREGGKFITYRMNIKSVEIFNSPAFYLQQNDIIYVEPRYRQSELEGIQQILQVMGYTLTSVTSIATLLTLLSKF